MNEPIISEVEELKARIAELEQQLSFATAAKHASYEGLRAMEKRVIKAEQQRDALRDTVEMQDRRLLRADHLMETNRKLNREIEILKRYATPEAVQALLTEQEQSDER